MEIKRCGSQPSGKGPAEYFTGTVRIDAPFNGQEPARVGGATVTFEPSARTAWHTHPLGQILIVISGLGWAQHEGGPIEEIFNNHSKRGWPRGQATTHRPNGTAIGQRKLKVGQDTADHQFHFKLGKRHANATPDPPTKRQILKRRIAAFQKPFGPEFIRIWVDILAVVSQIEAADDYGTRFK